MTEANARINKIFEDYPSNSISENDVFIFYNPTTGKTRGILAKDLFSVQDVSSSQWVSTQNYNISEPVIYNGQWWVSKIDNNIGNAPAENNNWTAENKVTVTVAKPWEPGIYEYKYATVTVGNLIYRLKGSVAVPFNSSASPDQDLSNWELLSSGGAGSVNSITFTATVENANPDQINLQFSEDVVGDSISGFSLPGKTIISISGTGDTRILVVDIDFTESEVAVLSYSSLMGVFRGEEIYVRSQSINIQNNVQPIGNSAPTTINLSSNSIDENNAVDDVVGQMSSDGVPAAAYSLVAGVGDDDNASFNINGSDIRASEIFDFETKSQYSILVQASNSEGSTTQQFNITINDVFESPPAQVNNVSAILNNSNMDITWTSVNDADTYTVERSDDGLNGWTALDNTITGTSFSDTTILAQQEYYYRVKAVNVNGDGPYSEVVAGNTVNFQDLQFGSTIYNYPKYEYGVFRKSPVNQLFTPTGIYKNGRTYFAMLDYLLKKVSIVMYDKNYGIDEMTALRGAVLGTGDSHHHPIPVFQGDRMYMLQEDDHNVNPISLHKSKNDNEHLFWDWDIADIGQGSDAPGYANFYDINGTMVVVHQYNDSEAGYNINTSGNIESGWDQVAKKIVARNTADETQRYQLGLYNKESYSRFRVVSVGRNVDKWFRFNVFDGEVNANGRLDWYTVDGTLIHLDGTITVAEADQGLIYYTGSNNNQGYIPVPASDAIGNFFMVHGDGTGGYMMSVWKKTDAAPINRAINFPDSPVLVAAEDFGTVTAPQMGACAFLMPLSVNKIYSFFKVNNGTRVIVRQYLTVDEGVSWSFVRDIDFGFDVLALQAPDNFFQIGNNTNFIFVAGGVPDGITEDVDIAAVKACFGAVQVETGDVFADAQTISESDFNLTAEYGSYFVESGKITNTGTTLNSLIDQGPNSYNINSLGSPVIDNSSTPTELVMDGNNDAFSLGAARFTGVDTILILMVVDKNGNNVAPITFSSDSDANNYITPMLRTDSDRMNWQGRYNSSTINRVTGNTPLGAGYHIAAYLFQPRSSVVMWMDGVKQRRDVVDERTPFEGTFLDSGWNRVEIGRLARNTTSYYSFKMKHLSIHNVSSEQQIIDRIKFLGVKYGINLSHGYL